MGVFAEKYWSNVGEKYGSKFARIIAPISVWYRLGVLWVEDGSTHHSSSVIKDILGWPPHNLLAAFWAQYCLWLRETDMFLQTSFKHFMS